MINTNNRTMDWSGDQSNFFFSFNELLFPELNQCSVIARHITGLSQSRLQSESESEIVMDNQIRV